MLMHDRRMARPGYEVLNMEISRSMQCYDAPLSILKHSVRVVDLYRTSPSSKIPQLLLGVSARS